MSDLISRQAAIDGKILITRSNGLETYSDEAVPVAYLQSLPSAEPKQICIAEVTLTDEQVKEAFEKAKCGILTTLSSVEPELSGKIERILDFLDTELHPIVSPEHWDVYSELHDMISMLSEPSAQMELNTQLYTDGFNDGYAQCEKDKAPWTPCSERPPKDDTEVFVYLFDHPSPYIAWVCDGCWFTEEFQIEKENYPKAWMPLPKPWKGEQP